MHLLTAFVLTLAVYQATAYISFAHKNPPHPDCAEHDKYITNEQVKSFNDGSYQSNNPVMKQHFLCIWKEKGAMNEAGVLQKNHIIHHIFKDLSMSPRDFKKAENCIVQKSNPADTAYDLYRCIAPLLKIYNH
ncbi:hypothetical protein WA026_010200 [Henosepilachna vigintioctopunctata]|uniref:Uncharacterized protein n=1 Tax=Henosepilachna vigintioctopunctata TaxID=420089 RepID=A0AAW1UGV6_9CUCU